MTKMKSFFGWHQVLSIGRRALLLTLPLWLAACGGTPGGGTPDSLVPTVTLSANPGTVASGGSTTVTWSSTNATSCAASGSWSGAKNTSGTQSFTAPSWARWTMRLCWPTF